MSRIDLNCDMGESYGIYTIGSDSQVAPYITSANIGCGWHGGDPLVIDNTIKLCKKYGIGIGAHPSLPDQMGFGRRNMDISCDEASAYIIYQVGAMQGFAKANGVNLVHVKPHGALYNMAAKSLELSIAIAKAIKQIDSNLVLLGLSGSKLIEAGIEIGLKVANEVFADRAYNEDGSLVKRGTEGAVITDEEVAIERVIRMATEGKVKAITGKDICVQPHSVCLHGDGVKAVEFAKRINQELKARGVTLASLS